MNRQTGLSVFSGYTILLSPNFQATFRMKFPKLFRKLTPILAVAVGVFMAAAAFLNSPEKTFLGTVAQTLFIVSLGLLAICIVGLLVFRSIENALLRQFGKPATATVLAVAVTNERVNGVHVYRVKLEVHPTGEKSFIGVAEDVMRWGNLVTAGDTVPVKYDPFTKEVALVFPKRVKKKEDDF